MYINTIDSPILVYVCYYNQSVLLYLQLEREKFINIFYFILVQAVIYAIKYIHIYVVITNNYFLKDTVY